MANEINVSISISVNKGGMNISRAESFKVDMIGDSMTHSVQEIDASAEVLVEADALDQAGWIFIKNLHASNYVDFARQSDTDNDEYLIRLNAGESCLFRVSELGGTGVIYAKASAVDTNVEYVIIEK